MSLGRWMGYASPQETDGVRKQKDLCFDGFKRAVLLFSYEYNRQEISGYFDIFLSILGSVECT